jgi:casein kinase 1
VPRLVIFSRHPFGQYRPYPQNSSSNPHTPHREHRHRDPNHRRGSRPLNESSSPGTPLVMGPTPVQIKPSRRGTQEPTRPTDRTTSVQPLIPTSRRQSQHQSQPQPTRDGSLTTPHPYANTPTPGAYRNENGYGRITPLGQNGANGSNPALNPPDSFLYGQQNKGADGTGSAAGPVVSTRVMGMYDNQIQRTDVDDGHGGKQRGIWAAFCCRA